MIEDGRIARVARALFVVDGNDPEEMIPVGSDMTEIGDGLMWQREAMAPAWTSYAGEARRMIAAMVALGIIE